MFFKKSKSSKENSYHILIDIVLNYAFEFESYKRKDNERLRTENKQLKTERDELKKELNKAEQKQEIVSIRSFCLK